jgi:hypothetical protein
LHHRSIWVPRRADADLRTDRFHPCVPSAATPGVSKRTRSRPGSGCGSPILDGWRWPDDGRWACQLRQDAQRGDSKAVGPSKSPARPRAQRRRCHGRGPRRPDGSPSGPPGFFTGYGWPQSAVSAVETTWCRAGRRSGRAHPLEPRRARLCRRRRGRHGGKLLRLVSAATARASGRTFSSAWTSPGRSATSVASAPGSNPPSRRTESTVGGETARQTAPPNAWLKQIRRPPATAERRDATSTPA